VCLHRDPFYSVNGAFAMRSGPEGALKPSTNRTP
jgi:hypothetical protein